MNPKISAIMKDCNVQGTLFVLKGYPVELYGGNRVNLADVISNKVGRLFQLATLECQVISFDEFIIAWTKWKCK